MTTTTPTPTPTADTLEAWRGFEGQTWRDRIDVRDFIVRNYTPYLGGSEFLSGPTVRTKQVWANLLDLMEVERERGFTIAMIETIARKSLTGSGRRGPKSGTNNKKNRSLWPGHLEVRSREVELRR